MTEISPSNSAQTQFVALLREMFQIQDLDLDFGIYRVLNQERVLIDDFLQKRLAPITREALGAADDSQRAGLDKELAEVVEASKKYKFPLEESDDYKRIKAELDALGNSDALETEVYNGLADFFGRYYDKGDFLSRPRYRKDVYALPYNGEEVKLHWANRDQYYIKSAQVLETFEWKLGELRVRFALRPEHTQHAENNNKEERRFVLALDENDNPIVTREDENGGAVLTVFFDFKKTAGGPRDLNADAEKKLRDWSEADAAQLLAPILATFSRTEKGEKSHFLHRLNSWTARGSFDFFVHKDLEGFLARELDFYLKNEVVQLDALLQDKSAQWEKTTLAKARAMHALGRKIIAFLASLEELQKRLWEKQKWITSTRLVLPLCKVPAALRSEVLGNAAQRDEWKTLYGVDVVPVSTVLPVAWSETPGEEWAAQFPDIAIDTKHFDAAFARRLWSELSREYSLDELWNGVLWNADNFAALNLMQKRFKEEIKCIYIDPPYNTDVSELLYKNGYKHSTWLAMIQDRLELSTHLMRDEAVICVTIDDYEHDVLAMVLDSVFKAENRLATTIIRNNPQGRSTVKGFAVNHEFGLFYSLNSSSVKIGRLARNEKQLARYDEVDEEGQAFTWVNFRKTGTDSQRADRRKQFFPLYVSDSEIRIPKMEWNIGLKEWENLEKPSKKEVAVWPIDENGTERVWSFGVESTLRETKTLRVEQENGAIEIYRPLFVNPEGALPRTWWDDARYAAGSHGTNLLTDFFGKGHSFRFPKSVYAVQDCVTIGAPNSDSLILDYFAGSGTTGHAVINLNRADGENGQRRYVLVEMGRYFDSVLVPRLKKAAFADKWKEGKPSEYSQRNGVAQTLVIHSLESYEDALEHLAAAVEGNAQPALPQGDEWTVRYALSLQTRDGELPLSDALFQAPFALQMRLGSDHTSTPENGGTLERTITPDAVATFNWLLGLRVHKLWFPDAENPKLAAVCGLLPDGKAAVVVWRHLEGEAYETADAALLAFWQSDEILLAWRAEHSVAIVYVNGDSTLGTQKKAGEAWEVASLEAEFRRLMFASAPKAPEVF